MSELTYTHFHDRYLAMISRDLPGYTNHFPLFSSEAIAERLFLVADKLIDNAKKFNLTSILEPEEIIRKHLIDSLIPLGLLLDENLPVDSILDVGTGAGFPLLPWACALTDYSKTAHLLGMDATGKKITHIKETRDAVGLTNLDAVQARAEEAAATELRETFSLVTARAVADLPVLMELCAPFVAPRGYFASLKGHAASEIEAARAAAEKLGLTFVRAISYEIPGGDCRTLVIYRKIHATPQKYPRRYADILKKPL